MKMHKIVFYISWVLLIFISGCEQVIDVDLNDVNRALVIEADLSAPDGVLTVVISKTGSFFDAASAEKVNNAVVHLENKSGRQEKAESKGNGIYKLEKILAGPGDGFKLIAEVDGIEYTATTTVKAPVKIDSISYSWYEGDRFFRPGYRFNLTLTDPPEHANYYRIRVYSNGYLFNRPNDMVVFSDADLNGQSITVRMHNQYYLEKGETAVIELMSIDRKAWEYFTTLGEVVNTGPGSPAPGNPVSNFNNGAMGYFYAWSYSRKTVTIEK